MKLAVTEIHKALTDLVSRQAGHSGFPSMTKVTGRSEIQKPDDC